MPRHRAEPIPCQICHEPRRPSEVLPAELVRTSIVETIRKTRPEWAPHGFICLQDLNRFRAEHVEDLLATETSASGSCSSCGSR